MALNVMQQQTNKNIADKANLIWDIANKLAGLYKPYEYGKVILPFTVLKRFDDALKDTKQQVLDMAKTLPKEMASDLKDGILTNISKYKFYNTSKFDFEKLVADPDNLVVNFEDYLHGYSSNVLDILSNFRFSDEIKTMVKGNVLFIVLSEFNSKKAEMSPKTISSQDMGYVFEELIRKFSESYDEQAGAHFTSRDIIYLMTELLVAPERESIAESGCTKTAYDMAMGTSQMLGCLTEKLKEINGNADLTCFGQEFNPETYAIAKADMLIKGGNASGMKYGDTLLSSSYGEEKNLPYDAFEGYTFDYIISNPPFGIDWKREEVSVKKEAELGFTGRFGAGLPKISDGQMLFMQNGIKKLKEGSGRMAIIQNASSLFVGDNGSVGIRKYVIENDLLEAIIQLPTDLFYNTGIATYIWIISKGKEEKRLGKVQLIDASKCFIKRRKNIGSKRVDLDENCINLIVDAYMSFDKKEVLTKDILLVESKVFENKYFGYTTVTVETAEKDEKGNYVLKKGNKVAKKGATDTETIPLLESIEEFFDKNVLLYNKDAFMDRSKDKVGYEIPFTRIFYKFIPPAKSEDIFAEIKQLESEETILMKELFGNE